MPNGHSETEQIAYRNGLKMLAVQLAGQFPGRLQDAEFVLKAIRAILYDHVFDEEPFRVINEPPPRRFSVVPLADRVSG